MIIGSFFLLSSCAVKKHKDISYLETATASENETPKLNVFTPRNTAKKLPVLIYVHGGYWNSGNKDIYGFFGRNFAKKDVVTVIPSYTLSPNANYETMTQQIAQVIQWTKDSIANYNGDPDQIFVTGHSAGGHLVALATLDKKYGVESNTVKGIILNDAAGLDMYTYLQNNPPTTKHNYNVTWTKEPATWKDASPMYYLDKDAPPFLIYLGSKTYPSIINSNERFLEALKPFQPTVEPIVLKKKHVSMITQYLWPWNDRFDEIKNFIEQH